MYKKVPQQIIAHLTLKIKRLHQFFFSPKKSNKYKNFILNVNPHKFLLFNIENLRLYQIFFSLKKKLVKKDFDKHVLQITNAI